MSTDFKRQLDLVRSAMAELLSRRKGVEFPQLPDPYVMPYPDFNLHSDMTSALAKLNDAVAEDMKRYAPNSTIELPTETEDPEESTADDTPPLPKDLPPILRDVSKLSPQEMVILNLGSPEDIAELAKLKQREQDILNGKVAPEATQAPSADQQVARILAPSQTGLGLLFESADLQSAFSKVPKDIDLDPSVLKALPQPLVRLYCLLFKELQDAQKHMTDWGIPAPSMDRMRKALHSLGIDKVGDAFVVLRSGRNDDPNNKVMAFFLSQILFYRVQNGQNEFLPEAREEAKKSCAFDERYPQDKLTCYRYHYVTCEMNFSKERAQEMLREYYLLNSDTLIGEEGLRVHNWYHLKALVLLSKLPGEFWSTYEIECIHTVAFQSIGGALIYLPFFRPFILQKLATESPEYDKFYDIEKALRLVYIRFEAAIDALTSQFRKDGKLFNAPAHTWTVSSRYLHTFLTNAPLPTIENLLANTSLDGRRNTPAKTIDQKLHDAGLHDATFWQSWIIKTSYNPDLYNDGVIPNKLVASEGAILKQFDELLKTLKAWEEPIVTDEKWQHARLYLAPVAHSKLLELGTGQPLGALAFGSGEAVYKNYYKGWSSLIDDEILASDNIENRAGAGVFWSVEEIMATFDGAERIMNDPNVGLSIRFKAGYRKYVQNRSKHKKTNGKNWQTLDNPTFTEHFRQYWWLYSILVPMAIMTFIVIVSARSYENAIRMIMVVFIFAIVGFAVFSQLLKKSGSEDDNNTPPS